MLATVDAYTIKHDYWSPPGSVAKLNVGRYDHSSCSLAGNIYVFGGYDGQRTLNSIERLAIGKPNAVWNLIEFPCEVLLKRCNALMVSLPESNQILIAGGSDVFEFLTQADVVDTDSLSVKSVLLNSDSAIGSQLENGFSSLSN